MARQLRIEYEGAFYHVTSRGNERRKIFFSKTDYEKFKEYLGNSLVKFNYRIHCYMLMTNHYHLLIETPNGNISKIMHYLNGSYTNYINIKRNRSGHLFQGRYKAILIDHDSYLLELSRYLHLNPVRAGMVTKPDEYPYSSYASYINRKKEEIIYRDMILKMVSNNKRTQLEEYKIFVQKGIKDEIENPLKRVYAGAILGKTQFIKNLLDNIKDEIFKKDEVIGKREFASEWKADEIIKTLSESLELNNISQKNNHKINRNIIIYILKKHTALTNRKIGKLLGDVPSTTVSKNFYRFIEKMENEKDLKKKINKIENEMSYVEG
jgi:putative transposase